MLTSAPRRPRPFLLLGVLCAAGCPLVAQAPPQPLAFLGFEVGARLDSVQALVQTMGGRGLQCRQSRRDPSVRECRATFSAPGTSQPVSLWLSSMDSLSGILMLSGELSFIDLDGWKRELETAYGVVGGRVQGGQWMQQWVRQGRMIRLTWRIEKRKITASVSLVDGSVLDGWGRRRQAASSPAPAPTWPPEETLPGQ